MPEVTASYGKKPISTEIIRCILDMLKRDANLENLRIATLRSLAFGGFFRYNEFCNITTKHIHLSFRTII